MNTTRRMMLALIAATVAAPALAQTYPDKPVKLIVTVAAGGPMDTIARVVADQLQAKLGQPVIVENRPGAGSTLGAKAVAGSPPDGLTLMWGTLSAIAIAPALYKDPGYDPKAFVPAAMVAEFPHVMVISPTVPATTMAEFLAYAKANRGKLNFGGSLGTPPQLLGSMFSKVADLGMTYVPYKGGAPSIPDLLAGRLQMAVRCAHAASAADQGRQAARACCRERHPLARSARRADACRNRLQGFSRQSVGRHHGAVRNARADHRQA